MTETVHATDVVARCTPIPAQHATNPPSRATASATGVQRTGLKALALKALSVQQALQQARNSPEKPCNNTTATEGELLRARLAKLADTEATDAELVRNLSDADIAECAGLSIETLRAYVRTLRDDDLRQRGKVPATESARAICARCGPIWCAPDVVAVAPIVDGWPRLIGCQWCAIRRAGKYVPRPPVSCSECRHFHRDAVNPDAGMGHCKAGCDPDRAFPSAQRRCAQFNPESAE